MGSFPLDSHRSPVFRLAESSSYIYTRHPAFPTSSLLTSSWSFLAIYPLHQTTVSFGKSKIPAQSLTWAIEAEPDGRLVEKTASVEAQATLQYLSPEKQNPGLSRRSTEGAHATCGGPYHFQNVRALSPSFFLFNESRLQISFLSSRARPFFPNIFLPDLPPPASSKKSNL